MRKAAVWWEQQSADLGDDFLTRVEAAFLEIELNPETGVSLPGGLRAKRVQRFPYNVDLRIHPTVTHILAVRHSRQRPLEWSRRDRELPPTPRERGHPEHEKA